MKPDEIKIGDTPLFTLPSGRRIYQAIEPGQCTAGFGKEGRFYSDFKAGDLILADANNKVIVGPVGFQAALDTAIAICESTPLVITNSRNMHAIATALIGLAATLAPPIEPEPVAPAATMESEVA